MSEFRAERDMIPVSSYGLRRDPNWTYTDTAGHEHSAKSKSLIEVQDDPDEPPFYMDADGEEYNAPTHNECRLCGEHISPDMVGPSPFQEYIPGPWRYYKDDQEITEEEYNEGVAELTEKEKQRLLDEARREVGLAPVPPEGWVEIQHPTSPGETSVVTEEAYELAYKPLGWTIAPRID